MRGGLPFAVAVLALGAYFACGWHLCRSSRHGELAGFRVLAPLVLWQGWLLLAKAFCQVVSSLLCFLMHRARWVSCFLEVRCHAGGDSFDSTARKLRSTVESATTATIATC